MVFATITTAEEQGKVFGISCLVVCPLRILTVQER